jgi:hypothetical protein
MLGRRQLLSSSMAAGLFGLREPTRNAASATSASLDDGAGQSSPELSGLTRAIEGIGTMLLTEVSRLHEFTEIAKIRDAQKTYLVTHAKIPDVIEVGVNVWFDVYDWHIKWQQPLAMGRDANNRRTITLFETLVVLQIDQPANFVGMPYDKQ